VAAARAAAEDLGYTIEDTPPGAPVTDSAEDVGRRLAGRGFALSRLARRDGRPRAWIEGGEATVRVPTDHGRGGRNQQTVLAALAAASPATSAAEDWPPELVIASIGTDGEDGPTDAAGAVADAGVAAAASADPGAVPRSLARCDAYPLLARTGGLIRTGPTGTNVADLRIVLACP
jgi:glycerate-2-kinase